MAKKVAVVISGAVSLGSYEAGVMYEVINAFAYHNSKTADPEQHFKIDVIVGTSAGAMTAAILARQLLFDGPSLGSKAANALYQVWVKKTRIEDLLNDQPDDKPDKSILATSYIRKLGAEYLAQPTAPATQHSASADDIRVGVAISNLNGVDYGIKTLSGHDFTYTDFEDVLVRTISRANPAGTDWAELRDSAIASGSFPFAFAVTQLVRKLTDYAPASPPATLLTPFTGPGSTANFTYCDGGMFDNEPLGLAKNLVDDIDQHLDEDDRYYFFVCPHSRNGDAVPLTTYNADNATLSTTPFRLVGTIMANAGFQDWVTSEQINHNIGILDKQAAAFAGMIAGGLVDMKPAAAYLNALAAQIVPNPAALTAGMALLRKQFAVECAQVNSKDPAQVDLFLLQTLVFQIAADLMDKDKMVVLDITADETTELAGVGLHAFTGFCSEVLREHDFQTGRQKALDFIMTNGIGLDKTYKPADGTPPPIKPVPAITEVPQALRQQLYDRFKQRIQVAINESDVAWYIKAASGMVAGTVLDVMGVKKALGL